MNAIVTSYLSSDSDDDIYSVQESIIDTTQTKKCQNLHLSNTSIPGSVRQVQQHSENKILSKYNHIKLVQNLQENGSVQMSLSKGCDSRGGVQSCQQQNESQILSRCDSVKSAPNLREFDPGEGVCFSKEDFKSYQNVLEEEEGQILTRFSSNMSEVEEDTQPFKNSQDNRMPGVRLRSTQCQKTPSVPSSQSVRGQRIPVNESLPHSGKRGAMEIVCMKRRHTGSGAEQTSTATSLGKRLGSLKKETILPYVPKSKRGKQITLQQNTDGTSTSEFLDPLCPVFKKAKLFSKKNIHRYFVPKQELIRFNAHQGCINRILWNPCFQDFILSASMDGVVRIWNVETTPSCVLEVSGHTQAVKDAKWHKDGVKVLSGGYDKFSRITDLNAEKEICANRHNSFVTCVIYHLSDPNVYLSGTSNDGIFAWDIRTKQIQDLTFLHDGQRLISAAEILRRNSTDKGIMVWDYKTATILSNQVFQEAFTCTALQVHPSGSAFLAQCNAGYIAEFAEKSPYKLNKYKRFEGHSVSGYHIGMDVSPDGSLLASGSSDGSVYVYNYRTSKKVKTLVLNTQQPCIDVAWSPTIPSLLASCDWNGQIFLHT